MKHKIMQHTMVFALTVVALPLTTNGQTLPPPSDPWSMQENEWKFEDSAHVWRYYEHDISRQVLFTIEKFTAPHLSEDNVVAWAYPFASIQKNLEEWDQLIDDMNNQRVALAIQASDGSYLVLSNDFARSLAEDSIASFASVEGSDQSCLYGLVSTDCDNIWAVSISLDEFSFGHDRSQLKQISSWNEKPLLSPDRDALLESINSP